MVDMSSPLTQQAFKTRRPVLGDAYVYRAIRRRGQLTISEWPIRKGGHTRTGLEDNVRLDRDNLAPSNAARVKRAADLCENFGRQVATWQQAREILGLRIPG